MRFTYAEAMTDPSYYLPLAQAAEAAGFDGFLVPDSICYPAESEATYPYTADGDRGFIEDKPFLEPFSIIPAMGAVTERIRFVISVLKLTVRHPVLVAKQAASTAVLTNDRLTLGVGTSPWPEDYEVCDVPFERRGQAGRREHRRDARAAHRRLVRAPRRDLRRPAHQAVPGAGHADPDHRRRPRRAGPATGGPQRRLDPRRRRPRGAARAHRPPARAARRGGPSRRPVRGARHLDGRLHARRDPAARGARASPT